MKIRILTFLLGVLAFSTNAQDKLLVAGSGWKQVAIVSKSSGTIEWSYDLNDGDECNSVRHTKEGNILFSYKKGAKLVTKSKETVWDFKINKGEELQSVQELPNGKYFLAICGQPSRFVTLSKKGKVVKEQSYDLNIERAHAQFRQVMPTKKSIIIPVLGQGRVIEIDKNNNIIHEVKTGGNVFAVKVLNNGNWLIGCGDAHKFVIANPKTKAIVKTVERADVKKCSLNFVAEIYQMKNGNFMIANWNGHSKDKTQPKIIELDKDNKVVWTLPHNDTIKNISAIDFL